MIRVELTHAFPVPVSDGFAYITDMKKWEQYWPDFVGIKDSANAKWGNAGDTVTVVLRLLSRERELNMKLEEFQKDTLVIYTSHQQGLPDARHERHFRAIPNGLEYRLVVTCQGPRHRELL